MTIYVYVHMNVYARALGQHMSEHFIAAAIAEAVLTALDGAQLVSHHCDSASCCYTVCALLSVRSSSHEFVALHCIVL